MVVCTPILYGGTQALKDPARRVAYDRRLAASSARVSGAIAEELDLDDLACISIVGSPEAKLLEAGGSCKDSRAHLRFEHPCRCGGAYAIDEGLHLSD